MWVVVKIRVPFWFLNIIRHLICRVPKGDPNFDNHPYIYIYICIYKGFYKSIIMALGTRVGNL